MSPDRPDVARALAARFAPAVLRQADAVDEAALIAVLPDDRRRAAVALTVRCRAGSPVLRVYRRRAGVLAVPSAMPPWDADPVEREPITGWWLDAATPDVLSAGCSRCREAHRVDTARVLEALRDDRKVLPLL